MTFLLEFENKKKLINILELTKNYIRPNQGYEDLMDNNKL